MSKVDIAADMNQDVLVTIADATAEVGNHLFQFFSDDKNVFNIASLGLSGALSDEIAVDPAADYEFTIKKELSQKLIGATNTYKHFLVDEKGSSVQKNYGDITVTVLTGDPSPIAVSFYNGDRKQTVSTNYQIKADSDTIYAAPPNVVEVVLTLPDANTMPGKRFEIKNIGQGTVRINTPHGDQLINLDLTGDSVHIKANGTDENDWECFYG